MEARDARGPRDVLDLGVDEGSDVLEGTADVSEKGNLPFAGGDIVGVEIAIFQTREPALHRSRGVAVGGTEHDVHPQVGVAGSALVRLVVRGLDSRV